MLGISTVWKSGEFKDGQKLMESLVSLGFQEIELEYRSSGDTFTGIKQCLKETNDVKIVSVHNFFPIPEYEYNSLSFIDNFTVM